MAFYELESWEPRPDSGAAHDEMIRRWFGYVEAHRRDLFPEWRSAQHFRQVQRNEDVGTGRQVMLFGYRSHADFLAYKERRKDWSGPYAEYKRFDPYQYFVEDSVRVTHWLPHERSFWLAWHAPTPDSFYDVVTWSTLPGVQSEHDDVMRQWFAFVRRHHDELFAEWHSARYFRGVTREQGEPINRFMMIFEYNHRAGFLAYKKRRNGYPGPYAEYLKIDPFIYFDEETKTIEHWQPKNLELWLDFSAQSWARPAALGS
jgi:hypothetical protein